MEDIKKHQRINQTVLGPLERPALQWLAARQPAWVNPDILTAIGSVGAAVAFTGFVLSNTDKSYLWLASAGFLINWYGDSLDGTLARFRNIQRPRYGYFVDHTVDSLNEALVILGLGLSPYLRFDIACLLLISYLLLSVLVFVRTSVSGVFQISYIRLGPTELRVIAVLSNTYVFFFGNPPIRLPYGALSVYDLIAATLAALLLVVYIVSMILQARQLAKEDKPLLPRPARTARSARRSKAVKKSRNTVSAADLK